MGVGVRVHIPTGFAVQNCECVQERRQDSDYLSVTESRGMSAGEESEKHPTNEDHDVGKQDLKQLQPTTAQTHTHTHAGASKPTVSLCRGAEIKGWRVDTVI